MKKFIIQTINGEIKHDFSFHLLEAVRYTNWIRNEEIYKIILSNEADQEGCIPVGSLEYVFSYLKKYHDFKEEDFKPLNVPESLMKSNFLKREAIIKNKQEISTDKEIFIKSHTRYKSFTDVVENLKDVPDDTYFVSEVIKIESEYRCFVFNGKLVGIQNYSGDFAIFPDVKIVQEMISAYQDAPPAYTLDVGINESGTFVIEVHPFISCGLYGFSDYRILPEMFVSAFNWQLKQK